MAALAALCLLLGLWVPVSDAQARRREPSVLMAMDGSDPNPIVAVRLGMAPPWRLVVGGEARLDGEALAPGTYDVSFSGDAVRLEGEGTRRASAQSLTLTSDTPVSVNGHRYRGALVLRRSSVLNRLPLDDYLRGVVGCEIGPSADFEALKAQAVVARTYTLGHLTSEITDDTRFQVYRGLDAETDSVSRAVDETSGQLVTWQGRLAREVCYHSTCGGRTESNENVFLTPPVAYLRSVECVIPIPVPVATGEPPEVAATDAASAEQAIHASEATTDVGESETHVNTLQAIAAPATATDVGESETHTNDPQAFAPRALQCVASGQQACERSTWAHWKVTWPAGEMRDLAILKTSPSGRVLQVRIGERVVSGDEIRRALPFTDAGGRTRPLHSTAFTLRREGSLIVAEGSGWGHGLGLCQWGARGMARAGRGYVDILTHYFPGTEVTAGTAHARESEDRSQ